MPPSRRTTACSIRETFAGQARSRAVAAMAADVCMAFVATMPKSQVGKVLRRALRQRELDRQRIAQGLDGCLAAESRC
mgnify:CR=1 FL=1